MKAFAIITFMVLSLIFSGLAAVHFYLLDGLDGWLYSLAYEEDTIFSEGYSDAAFRRVYPGMPEAELRRLLRAPLGEVWIYGNNSTRTEVISFSGVTVSYVHRSERFHAPGAIEVGMKKGEVIHILGEPQKKSFVYAKSRHDMSHRVRTVALARGVVLGKRAYFYVD